MTSDDTSATGGEPGIAATDQAHFRRTLIGVMTVQVLALIALWLLQSRYTP